MDYDIKISMDILIGFIGIIVNSIIAVGGLIALYFTGKNIKETFRPYVHLSVKIEGATIKMVLQNTGARAAYNVAFEFENPLYPKFVEQNFESERQAFNFNTKSVFYSLAPNSNITWDFDNIFIRYKDNIDYNNLGDEVVGVKITYSDYYNGKAKFQENYKFNMKNFIAYAVFETDQAKFNKKIDKIETHLKSISNSLVKIVQRGTDSKVKEGE